MLPSIAMIHIRSRSVEIAWRLTVTGLCAVGIFSSLNFLRADNLARLDTANSLRAAIRLEPDAWKYSMRLAALDEANGQRLLETVVRLDPYNAEADIELALRLEAEGQYSQAEKLLQNAFAIDHTFLPRWSLANFYFRRGNMPAFWLWARMAAEIPSDQTEPLFELCWRASTDPDEISRNILNNSPELIGQYLNFLLDKDQLPAAAEIADRLMRFGDPAKDNGLEFSVIDRLIGARDGSTAKALWNALIEKHWVIADQTAPNNPNFARDPLPVGFDWSLNSNSGMRSWLSDSGLETEFSGRQPEECKIAEQSLILTPGNYVLEYAYRTDGIAPETGLKWQIIAPDSETPLAESPDLSSESLDDAKLAFTVPPATPVTILRLHYRRDLGTPRIAGTLTIHSVQIHPAS
jgi:tetratricopeptide (TPR) repeat protein